MKKYLNNIILLRFFCIILVVLGHSTFVYNGWSYDIKSSSFFFSSLCKYIYTFHMPLFMSISGYLFYYNVVELGQYDKKNNFVRKKAKRLLVPMILVFVFWSLPLRVITGYYYNIGLVHFKDVLFYIIKSLDLGHLWYLLILFFFEMIAINYYDWFENRKKHIKLIIVFICSITSIIYYMFDNLLNYLFLKAMYLFVFFIIGYFLRRNRSYFELKIKKQFVLICIGIHLIMLIMKFIIQNYIVYNDVFNEFLKHLLNFDIAVLVIIVMYYICNRYSYLANNNGVRYISDKSMEIYLYHEPIIYIVIFCGKNLSNSIILVFLNFVISFFGALIVAIIVKKIKIICKMIISHQEHRS